MRKNTKNESRKKRKVFMAILMTLFTGLILTGSAYAWFTANQKVTVSTLDVNVAAENGLQVSVDGNDWKAIVSKADIDGATATYPTNTNQLPWATGKNLSPVSTVGEVENGKLKMFAGKVDAEAGTGTLKLTATRATEQKGDVGQFVAFDLFFKVDKDSQIKISKGSDVTAKDTDKGLKNSARVAWLVEGNAANGTALNTIQSLSTTSNTDTGSIASGATNLMVWEPNADLHTATARAHVASNYPGTDLTAIPVAMKGVKAEINTPQALNSSDPLYFDTVKGTQVNSKATDGIADNTMWFHLKQGITKVRFYLWIEGQDVDCENTASGSAINFNMAFEIA